MSSLMSFKIQICKYLKTAKRGYCLELNQNCNSYVIERSLWEHCQMPVKEAQPQWSQAQTIHKKLGTAKFFFFLIPLFPTYLNWILNNIESRVEGIVLNHSLHSIVCNVTVCLRKIPSELISKIDASMKIRWNERNWYRIDDFKIQNGL